MMHRLVKDESGMTMGLVVIMIFLIGVMGAGLLTFVQTDLASVIEANRSRKALEIAEAGVQVAKSHLRQDSFREHYDRVRTNDCYDQRVGVENWSPATEIYTDLTCSASSAQTRPADQVGVTRNFGGGRFRVTIECYDQLNDPVSPDPCNGGAAGPAPEPNVPASQKKFFKITSTGYSSTTGDGAVRKIEAIYFTAKRTYAPIAFWTPRNVNFDGTTCVRRMSFFAGRNITGVTHGSGCGPANPYGSGKFIAHRPPTTEPPLPPADAVYEDWKTSHNTTGRVDAGGAPLRKVGFGALGRVCGGSSCSADSHSVADGYNDYDRTTGTKGQNKTFVAKATDPANQITFPFDTRDALSNPSAIVDPGLVEEMRSAAEKQGNYIQTTGNVNINSWPGQGAIYFVDGANATFRVNTTPKAKGVLVVRNGNLDFNNSSNGFEGVIIVIGNGSTTGTYTQPGGVQLDGYVAASGDINIKGNVSPSTSIDYTNLNSFFDVGLWSWRELYR